MKAHQLPRTSPRTQTPARKSAVHPASHTGAGAGVSSDEHQDLDDAGASFEERPPAPLWHAPEDKPLTAKELAKRAVAAAMLGMALLTPLQSKRTVMGLPPPPPPKSSGLVPGTPSPPTPGAPEGSVPQGLEDIELVTHGASQKAVDEAAAVIEALKVEPRFQKPFRRAKIVVVIVPHDTSLTALPEFASLKGTKTFDGRLWDDVRGAGGHACHDGKICVAVPEENLARLPSDPYGANSIAMHELTHAVFDHVVGKDVQARVKALFEQRTNDKKQFVTPYAASNVQEYWAESTNAFFSRHTAGDTMWLVAHDPELYAIFVEVYGPPIVPGRPIV